MEIKSYPKGGTTKLSANFKASEFACKGSGCCSTVLIDTKLVEYLQQIRDHFNKKVIITSAYRCETHNKSVNGASGSYHTKGQAADIMVVGIAPAEVAKYAESIGILGIGLYETDSDGYFVHVDTRTTKSFWYGQSQLKRTTFGAVKTYTVKHTQLSKGNTGENVRALQILLIGNGYSCGKSGADGDFGANTEKAVKKYQKNRGLTADGIVGENTMKSLLGV